MIRTRRRRNHVSQPRLKPAVATRDFMADRLADGSRYRTLNAVDHRTRTCVGIAVERGFSSQAVIESLNRWIREQGKPEAIQVDNGTEFTANAFDAWAYARGIAVHFITPGSRRRTGSWRASTGSFVTNA